MSCNNHNYNPNTREFFNEGAQSGVTPVSKETLDAAIRRTRKVIDDARRRLAGSTDEGETD